MKAYHKRYRDCWYRSPYGRTVDSGWAAGQTPVVHRETKADPNAVINRTCSEYVAHPLELYECGDLLSEWSISAENIPPRFRGDAA